MSKSAAFITGHFCVSPLYLSQLLCGQIAKSLAILYTKMQMKVAKKLNVNKPDHMCAIWVVSAEVACFPILYSFLYVCNIS